MPAFPNKSNLQETNYPDKAQKKGHPMDGLLAIDKPELIRSRILE
jgi:hypothetical protein